MSIEKKYLKSKSICKVTFRLPKEAVGEAEKVSLVGEFNNWDGNMEVMQSLKDGSFKTTIDLEAGKEYQFRYLIDGKIWTNDELADKFVPSGIGADQNSVVVL
ncbi:MAG TPA: isoamylase early set domain-containing protein [Chitinophagales bacterium]|nr:isoamylase early set domain-containing protein [Chitinophagales bacterium]